MEKIYVQRKIEVWVKEIFYVDEVTDTTIDAAIDYDIDYDSEDTLWETQVDLGPVEVYDKNRNKIYSNIENE